MTWIMDIIECFSLLIAADGNPSQLGSWGAAFKADLNHVAMNVVPQILLDVDRSDKNGLGAQEQPGFHQLDTPDATAMRASLLADVAHHLATIASA